MTEPDGGCRATRQRDGCTHCRMCGIHWDEDEIVTCRFQDRVRETIDKLRRMLDTGDEQ